MITPKTIFLILIFLVALMEACADILFKKWSLDNRSILLGVGLALYFIATVIFAFSLKYEFLSKAISIYAILNTLLIVLAGILLFNETLTITNKIGILLGIISVILIEI
jgi:multidrug transporter EmrE-like cation transporter